MLVRAPGESAALEYADVPAPAAPPPGHVVLDVHAAGCNFADILTIQGRYQKQPTPPFSPGFEAAGIVREVGEGVTEVGVGERVFGVTVSGAYAERAVADQRRLYALPEDMSFAEGAAFCVAYQTAWCGLVQRAALRRGETLVVHAAAGGTGLAAVQLGRALGARVIATAGSPAKCAVAREAGAHVAVDYRAEDWVERVRQETRGAGADVIYDPVGGDVFDGSTRCLGFEGRLLVVGFASGRIPAVAANRILLKNIAVVGVYWDRYAERDPALVRRWMVELLRLRAADRLRPLVWKTFALVEAEQALAALGSRESIGKVVLVP